ncbi:hypothetical protein F5880DRAFT_1616558 [Lentinula raphanica]|nr:hypothetical protein F5880DRAFT_1616558 [Lentinula raphanica]
MPSRAHIDITDNSNPSDDEAPEAVSLSQTKSAAKKRRKELHDLDAQANKRRKVEEDGSSDDEENDIEARMLRAMQQAEEEEEKSDEEVESDGDEEESDAEMRGLEGDGDDDDDDDDDEEEEEEEEGNAEAEVDELNSLHKNPNHLPDYLFASVLASTKTNEKKSTAKKTTKPEPNRTRRRKKRNGGKDHIVGSRLLRITSDSGISSAPRATLAMQPSSKVKRFIDKNLLLKTREGDRLGKRGRGYERRAANIGSLRRLGPANNFVRS